FTPGSSGNTSGTGDLSEVISLAAGGSVTYTVTASIDPGATGSLSNTATVTPPLGVTDPTPGNDSATDTDLLTPHASLSISKTTTSPEARAGEVVLYTIVVTNSGPSTALGAAIEDLVPAALTGVTWTALASAGSSVAALSGTGDVQTSAVVLPGGS